MNALNIFVEGYIIIMSLGSMLMVNAIDERARHWAPVIGLLAQPAWMYTTAVHEQWGLFACTLVYTYAWGRGYYNNFWRKP